MGKVAPFSHKKSCEYGIAKSCCLKPRIPESDQRNPDSLRRSKFDISSQFYIHDNGGGGTSPGIRFRLDMGWDGDAISSCVDGLPKGR